MSGENRQKLMTKPDKQAQAREIKLAALEAALKAEIAAWMPGQATEGGLPAHAAALVAIWHAVLADYTNVNQVSTREVLAAGMGLLGSLLVQAAVGNEWPREKEAAVRAWVMTSLAELPFVSERDEDLWSPAQQEILREWAIEAIRTLPFVTGKEADAHR